MKRSIILLSFFTLSVIGFAQVKSSYEYNTAMPYGTLDIRTKVSSTNYYYLQEGKTFSFRESSPGVRTNTYRDMTTWDSSPYGQGNLRQKNGTVDKFIMNYRLLKPVNYNASYVAGYPLIVLMHGAVERANCYYNQCYHSNFSYDPNVNSPTAPKTVDHQLLNNDYNVNQGGKQHIDARNLAGAKLPNDPTMPARAFPGFVLIPQMMNVWDSLNVQDVIRIVRLHCQTYRIDPNRIYIHGLSIGGYAVYEAIKRAPWLFAAALPMSAVREAGNIFKHNQQGKVIHISLWAFQGGTDKNPTPSFTNDIMNKFKAAGALPRYTLYPTLGHAVWNKAYSEPDFFTWMLTKNKSNLHAFKGITAIIKSKSQYPKLMLAEGFLAYQWEKDGVIISTAKSNTYTATIPGKYRARFSRLSTVPTATQWNTWSATVTITETTATTTMASLDDPDKIMAEVDSEEETFSATIYPNPSNADNLNLQVNTVTDEAVEVKLIDQLGRVHYHTLFKPDELQNDQKLDVPALSQGMYILWINQGGRQIKQRVLIRD